MVSHIDKICVRIEDTSWAPKACYIQCIAIDNARSTGLLLVIANCILAARQGAPGNNPDLDAASAELWAVAQYLVVYLVAQGTHTPMRYPFTSCTLSRLAALAVLMVWPSVRFTPSCPAPSACPVVDIIPVINIISDACLAVQVTYCATRGLDSFRL